jgi:hypothetical protein|tara:strand:+ start:65 stop:460 length:396 start_codon:yes stop_codon:yes gene_type:complete
MVCPTKWSASATSGVGDSPGDTYVLYIDQESGLVKAIRYTVTYFSGRLPSTEPPKRETLFYYEDYVTVDGLTVPRGIGVSVSGWAEGRIQERSLGLRDLLQRAIRRRQADSPRRGAGAATTGTTISLTLLL